MLPHDDTTTSFFFAGNDTTTSEVTPSHRSKITEHKRASTLQYHNGYADRTDSSQSKSDPFCTGA